MYSWGHKTQPYFLARAALHWHVEEHEAEEIVSSTCCPPSFVGCRRGEYVPEKQKKTSVDFRFGLWASFLQSSLTLKMAGATYFGLGGSTPVLNRSNGNQGWLTFFPRNACTRTVTLLPPPTPPCQSSQGKKSAMHTFHHCILSLQYHPVQGAR